MDMKNIIKRSGEQDEFDVDKLRKSLFRSGAGEDEIDSVVDYITEHLTDGMSTHELYKLAYAQLRKKSTKAAGRYRLKKPSSTWGQRDIHLSSWWANC